MLEHYCDVLIIGTDLSGLITGAFLARRGLTVHVLEVNPFADNEKEPDPFCVAHLHSRLLRSILGRLNIPEGEIQKLSNLDSPLQIIFPKKRIDVCANPIIFYEELEREFPDHLEGLKLFYENLVHIKHQVEAEHLYSHILPHSFRERRKLAKFVKTHRLDQRLKDLGLPLDSQEELKKFIMAQLKLVTYSHAESPFALQVAELLNPIEGEILSIKGGHHYLKKLFLDRIEHHEGAYRRHSQVAELLYRNGIFVGAKLNGQEGNILSRYVIWNTQLKRLADYLPKLFRFRGLKKAIKKLEPKAYWFSSHFSLPAHFIPPPMKENLILIQDPKKQLDQTNFLYVQLQPGTKETRLTVSYLLDNLALTAEEDYFNPIHQKILDLLHGIIPFSNGELKPLFPLPATQYQEDTLFPMKENDFEIFKQAATEHPVYSHQVKSFTDLFPISYKTAAPNLYLTAPEILNTMGYEGKYMLGLKVTDTIWEDVEKAKKHAMRQEKRIA